MEKKYLQKAECRCGHTRIGEIFFNKFCYDDFRWSFFISYQGWEYYSTKKKYVCITIYYSRLKCIQIPL